MQQDAKTSFFFFVAVSRKQRAKHAEICRKINHVRQLCWCLVCEMKIFKINSGPLTFGPRSVDDITTSVFFSCSKRSVQPGLCSACSGARTSSGCATDARGRINVPTRLLI